MGIYFVRDLLRKRGPARHLIAALLAMTAPADALGAKTTVTLEPAADTWVNSKDPERNYFGGDRLELDNTGRMALMRFDLSSIPASAVISSARLEMTFDVEKNQTMDLKFMVCDLRRDFQEREATFRVASKTGPWGFDGLTELRDYCVNYRADPIRLRNPGTGSVDAAGVVRAALEAGGKTALFTVGSSSANIYQGVVYGRRAAAEKRPRLRIEYDPTAPKAITDHPAPRDKFGPVTVDGGRSANPDGSKAGLEYLWTVDLAAPASTYSPGQELGRAAKLRFDPDVPGFWRLRLRVTNTATKEWDETRVELADLQIGAHPRMGINEELLGQMRALRAANRPEWARFEEWLGKKWGVDYGSEGTARLLGYLITKKREYFDSAWGYYVDKIYVNKKDRSGGTRAFFGPCGAAVYCDDHDAGFLGGHLTADLAVFYDWGYDALTPEQREDIVKWLNAATEYNFRKSTYAHTHFRNDGVIITSALAAVVYATYGENPEERTRMEWFRQEWGHTLEVLDTIGRGGAMGEGNAYGEASYASLIAMANNVYYASGENLFYAHPWFRRHLAYEAFSTYPKRLEDADDPLGHANPPTPGLEGAALGGDDDRGLSWHSVQLRPNGLALSRMFPNTEEAEIWNWVFRQKDCDAGEAWADLLYYSPPPRLTEPKRLSFFDPGMGYVYIRSDWKSKDATWIASWAGPHVDTHQHLDQGSFTLFKRRDLAAKTGNYDYNVTTAHFLNYYTRTISSNNLLIGDPNEYFWPFIGYWGCDGARLRYLFTTPDGTSKACIANDGGQRTMAPYSLAIFDNEEFRSHKQDYDVARVTSFSDNGKAAAWVSDITNAYNNPGYTAPGSQPKVTKVYRKFVYLREPDVLLVADTVDSTNPNFEKSWVIHSVDQLEAGGTVKTIDAGESIHTGTDTARIVVDDKKPGNWGQVTADLRSGYAALQIKTLFPNQFQYHLYGGREANPTAHIQQFQTDPKVLEPNHLHRHFKDFWVKDYSEGTQPDHLSANWAPVYPQEVQTTKRLTTFIGGYGRWRLQAQPTTPSKNDYFLNVLKPTLEPGDSMPATNKFETADTFGVSLTAGGKTYKVTFTKETLEAPVVEGMDLTAPAITGAMPDRPLAAGTRQAVVSVTTNEPASCRFSYQAGTTYPFMTGVFASADGLAHTATNKELNGGDSYSYFVRCMDRAGNENLEDYRVTFSVGR